LQETCLIGQLMDKKSANPAALTGNAVQAVRLKGWLKLCFLIVYNFFDKCLNRVLADAFGAPKGCSGHFFHRLGRSHNLWDV
jgi:hypothetical protein